jgi:hypothetical protein
MPPAHAPEKHLEGIEAMLNFIDQLDEEQASNAEKVARAAKRAGVDPALAVAIAFQESKLRSNPPRGSSGEIGMMQVMPGTGKGMGFNEKQLGNLEQNIEAGIQYLKKGLEATGNDPQLAAIYYNGGPGAIQAMTSGKEPDPRVFDYLRSVNSYGAFAPRPESQQAGQPAGQPEVQPGPPVESDQERDARIQEAMDAQERRMGQVYGAGTGAVVSAYRLGKEKTKDVAFGLGESAESGRISAQTRAGLPAGGMPPAAPAAAPAALPAASTGVPQARAPSAGGPTQLGVPGTYPTATGPGSATFNYGRVYGLPEIEAGRALGTGKAEGEVWDLLNKRQQALTDIRQRFPGDTFVENPRYGGIMTPDQGAGRGPRQSFVSQPTAAPGQPPQAGGLRQLPPRQPIPTTPPPPSGLQMVIQDLRSLARPVVAGAAAAGRYVVPPLALAGAGGEAADVYSELRKEDPDYIKAALSGVAGVSGLAALAPPLTIPATVVGGSAALLNYLREKGKQERQQAPSLDYAAP